MKGTRTFDSYDINEILKQIRKNFIRRKIHIYYSQELQSINAIYRLNNEKREIIVLIAKFKGTQKSRNEIVRYVQRKIIADIKNKSVNEYYSNEDYQEELL